MNSRNVVILLGTAAAAAFLVVMSMGSVSITHGQGTDVGTDVGPGPGIDFRVPGGPAGLPQGAPEEPEGVPGEPSAGPPSQPPATFEPPTVIEEPTAPGGAETPTAAESPAAAELPSAGSGGLLAENAGVPAWLIFTAVGAAFLAGTFLIGIGGLSRSRYHRR